MTDRNSGAAQPAAPAFSAFDNPPTLDTIENPIEAEEAAAFLHYSPRTIKQMAREGRIPTHPIGDGPRKRWFFFKTELAQFLRSRVNSGHGDTADRDPKRRVQ